ncbi:MAG: hypothetical protein KGD64_08155 [Candidatus Heimdallarchaeota archaeon]|nr:hypothetical protein [Candidatus Heimdallarchaeota archaeon]
MVENFNTKRLTLYEAIYINIVVVTETRHKSQKTEKMFKYNEFTREISWKLISRSPIAKKNQASSTCIRGQN